MKRWGIITLLLSILVLANCTAGGIYIPPTLTPLPGQAQTDSGGESSTSGEKVAIIETHRGTIRCQLRPDAAPKHVANFEELANQGWYDGHTFFRVEPGFVIQGGSPTDNATGDIGYTVEAEIQLPHNKGALAAARTSDQVNPERRSSGSQFYITLEATPHLDGAYTVFGYCDQSMDVIRQIQIGDVMNRVRVEEQ
ncbi:MAG: peptidylprolyl isomerase [Chloroflexia bacterium]|nr:peptidylprolyl isomerase [Chloroflexia bacterium]